ARGAPRRGQGRTDPRDPENSRPGRAAACVRHFRSDAVGARRAVYAVQRAVLDQGYHRTGDTGLARPQEGAPVAPADGGRRRLTPALRLPTSLPTRKTADA